MNLKKVLIVSYYFPPCGGIGVLRCLKIAKYLREFGWEAIVYTATNPHYPSIDEGNFKDIPDGMTILKQPIFEPYSIYKKFTGKAKNENVNNAFVASDANNNWKHTLSVWIRSNFFIPDARSLWVKPSVKFLVDYIKKNPVDAIFSDGPPHSNTLIAALVKEKTGTPWLMDFQDPWTQVDYYQRLSLTAWADAKHKRLEQQCFRLANKTTIVSPTWKRDLEKIGAKNVSVIVWGYDEDDFKNLHFAPDWKFTLTHSGLIGNDRLPDNLFRAIAELSAEDNEFKSLFRLQLIGQTDKSIKTSIKKHKIEAQTTFIEQIPRNESLKYIVNSQLLLLLLNQADNAMGRIPGKLFEYLASKRPTLCLGLPNSDTDNILRETEAGHSVRYEDLNGIKSALKMYFDIFRKEGIIPSQTKPIDEYTNRNLTKKIAQLLNEIIKK